MTIFMHSWHIKILYMSVSFSYKIKMFLNKFALISNYSMYHKLILSFISDFLSVHSTD